MDYSIQTYLQEIQHAVMGARFLDKKGKSIAPETAYTAIVARLETMKLAKSKNPAKLLFVGNGGSAAIASHLAEDFSKAAGIRASCFNDGALLSCLANDYSFAEVFERALGMHADPKDLVVAISSSGASPNIINAARKARDMGCGVITLSGFDAENPLARLGSVNIFTPAPRPKYGIVENAHQVILHYILDRVCLSSPN